jgi:plastocyanin
MTRTAPAVVIGALLLGAPVARGATVEGLATIDGKPAAHSVVYLEGATPPRPTVPADRVIVDQKNLAFEPRVLPVVRGTVIEFTNSDDVQHNVFSPSVVAGKFNLGTYGPGAARTVTLDQPGDVLVLCNIHMEMEAHVLVLEGPHFATVAEDGSYRIPDVPAGSYAVRIWSDGWLTHSQTVDLPASGTLRIDITARK